MDSVTLGAAKAYANHVASGFASVEAVVGTPGAVKFTVLDGGDDVVITVPTVKGDKGDRSTIEIGTVESGSTPSVTNSGDEHDAVFDFVLEKGDAPTITEVENTVYNYQVKFDGSNSVTTPNLKGSAWFFGTAITSTDEAGVTAIVANSKLYDMYLNTNTDNLYRRTDYNPVTETSVDNHWVKIGTLQGKEGLNAYRTWLTIEGNEGKTIQQWVEETSGSSYEIQKVWEKPSILDEDTELNVWYMYKTGVSIPTDEYVARTYTSTRDGIDSVTAGTKYTLKIDEGETTTWLAFTVENELPALEDGQKYVFHATLNTPNVMYISKFEPPFEAGVRESEIVGQVVVDNVSTTGAQTGYTELVGTAVDLPDEAWLYVSSPIEHEITSGWYSYWNGTAYVNLQVVFDAELPEGFLPVVMWNERYSKASLWGYNTADEKVYVMYPFYVTTYQTDHVPEGHTDASSWATLTQIGTWNQTIYVSASGARADASDITLTTGANFSGVVMRTDFNEVIGTEDLKTEASTVKGAINELNDLMRTGTDAEFDTQVKNVIGAINELNGKMIDKSYESTDVNKVLQIKSKVIGDETVYEPQATALKQTMTASETVSDGDILSASAVKTILDALMPIGLIVLGAKPTYGTWESYNFGGYICVDTSLASGTTMIEHLPNITASVDMGRAGYTVSCSGAFTANASGNDRAARESGNIPSGFSLNASKSSNVYGSSGNHYNVETKGTNMTAWIRTA